MNIPYLLFKDLLCVCVRMWCVCVWHRYKTKVCLLAILMLKERADFRIWIISFSQWRDKSFCNSYFSLMRLWIRNSVHLREALMQMLATVVWLITLEPRITRLPVWLWWKDQCIFMLRWNDATHCIMSSANVVLIGLQIIVTSTTSNKSSGYLNTLSLPWGPMKDVRKKRRLSHKVTTSR